MMWRIFKREDRQAAADKTAGLIAAFILKLQFRLSRRLQQWERRYSLKRKKIFFATLGLLALAYCSYTLTHALRPGSQHSIKAEWLNSKKDSVSRPLSPPIRTRATHNNPATTK